MSQYRLLFIEEGRYVNTHENTKEYLEQLFDEDKGWCFTTRHEFIELKKNKIRFEIVEVPDDFNF